MDRFVACRQPGQANIAESATPRAPPLAPRGQTPIGPRSEAARSENALEHVAAPVEDVAWRQLRRLPIYPADHHDLARRPLFEHFDLRRPESRWKPGGDRRPPLSRIPGDQHLEDGTHAGTRWIAI